MKILAIETSCDETAASVVEGGVGLSAGVRVLSNVIASQIDLHAKTGGVVPEVAAREHVLKIMPVMEESLNEAFGTCGDDAWTQIDAIAVTKGPGLISSLIIGTETASVISYVKEKPLIPVQHIIGHIYSNWLDIDDEDVGFPLLILTVSGGHNELILMTGHGDFEILGETRDDAAGEAFDKVARIMGMGYPGGPVISKAALEGDVRAFDLPRVLLEKGSLNFSFSGLKTAVLTEVKEFARENDVQEGVDLPEDFKNNLSASFQEVVCDILSEKVVWAVKNLAEKGVEVKEVHLAGGVSANLRLRELMKEKLDVVYRPQGLVLRHPKSITYCTDNAAMIGAAGFYLYERNPQEFVIATNVVPTTEFSF